MEINSIEMTLTLPQEKKKEDCATVPGSTLEVISLHTETKTINRSRCINSYCNSASTSAISSHAATVKFKIQETGNYILKLTLSAELKAELLSVS